MLKKPRFSLDSCFIFSQSECHFIRVYSVHVPVVIDYFWFSFYWNGAIFGQLLSGVTDCYLQPGVVCARNQYFLHSGEHLYDFSSFINRDVTAFLRLLLRKEGFNFHSSSEMEIVRTIKEVNY